MINIKDIIDSGRFPTTKKKAIELINKVNAIRELESKELNESKTKEERPIHAAHYYIKPIFELTIDKRKNGKIVWEKTIRKIGPTILKEVIVAHDEMEATKYLQRMVDRNVPEAKIRKAKRMMVIGLDQFHKVMDVIRAKYAIFPIIDFHAFRKKGYKILRRSYLKPSVRALAKGVPTFF
jgi:hypothetical protein